MIGVLVVGNPDPSLFLSAFRKALEARGYVDGRTIKLDIRSAGGNIGALPALAAGLVRSRADVIVGYFTPTVKAAKQATAEIPIVMAGVGDPVGTGLVASLARPGGNITGVSLAAAEIAGKSLELVREIFPAARAVAVLVNTDDPYTRQLLRQTTLAAKKLALDVQRFAARGSDPYEPIFAEAGRRHADAILIQGSMLRQDAINLALKYRLPAISWNGFGARMGALLSYSADNAEVFSAAADYVDRILKGAKPADLPVELPRKFVLRINVKTAEALGVMIPPQLLTLADEVIE